MFWERDVLNFNKTPMEITDNSQIVKFWYDRGYLCLVEDKRAKKMIYLIKDKSFRGIRGVFALEQIELQERLRRTKLVIRSVGKFDFASIEKRLKSK